MHNIKAIGHMYKIHLQYIFIVFGILLLWRMLVTLFAGFVNCQTFYFIFEKIFMTKRNARTISTGIQALAFSEVYILLWLIEILSIVSFTRFEGGKLLNSIVFNAQIFNYKYFFLLPRKTMTKSWWKMLNRRKPTTSVKKTMFVLSYVSFFYLAYLIYLSDVRFLVLIYFIFYDQFKINFKCAKQMRTQIVC